MPKLLIRANGRPTMSVGEIAKELQALQRQRSIVLKSRNMQSNRLQAIVAGTLGYQSSMAEKDRRQKFKEADTLIKQIAAGEVVCDLEKVIRTTLIGIEAFNSLKDDFEGRMVAFAKQLPVASWVQEPEQRGFGLLFLAIVIGETGDLFNYRTPPWPGEGPRHYGYSKLWRRLGCAPWTFDGKTLMGATWRSGKYGKLPASEGGWEEFGYSPRRRSIAYLIGEGIVKQNGATAERRVGRLTVNARPCGPYRNRYDQAKRDIKQLHPEYSDLRCHRHGMLLATKLLLKRLWLEWHR